jgi:hypothetical protein
VTRTEWFKVLATLAYPAAPEKAEIAFVAFIPWFKDLPDAAFTKDSIDHVITSPRKMAIPSYDEIRKPLAAWWRDNRPAAVRLASEYPLLPGPAPHEKREPTEVEKAAVADVVAAFKATGVKRSSTFAVPEENRPKAIHLNDEALLANYEHQANDENNLPHIRRLAEFRARALRQKLGVDEREAAFA